MRIWEVYADAFYLGDIHAWQNKSADKEMLLPFKIFYTNLTLPEKNEET